MRGILEQAEEDAVRLREEAQREAANFHDQTQGKFERQAEELQHARTEVAVLRRAAEHRDRLLEEREELLARIAPDKCPRETSSNAALLRSISKSFRMQPAAEPGAGGAYWGLCRLAVLYVVGLTVLFWALLLLRQDEEAGPPVEPVVVRKPAPMVVVVAAACRKVVSFSKQMVPIATLLFSRPHREEARAARAEAEDDGASVSRAGMETWSSVEGGCALLGEQLPEALSTRAIQVCMGAGRWAWEARYGSGPRAERVRSTLLICVGAGLGCALGCGLSLLVAAQHRRSAQARKPRRSLSLGLAAEPTER